MDCCYYTRICGEVYWFHSIHPSFPCAVFALQHLQFWMDSLHISHEWSLAWEGVSRIMIFDIMTFICKIIQPWLAIKLLKYATSCHICFRAGRVLDGFFPHLAQMIASIRGFVVRNDFWPWPMSPRSFSYDFAIKLLKYGTSCHVRSTACTILVGFFPYLAQMITSMSQCMDRSKIKFTWVV